MRVAALGLGGLGLAFVIGCAPGDGARAPAIERPPDQAQAWPSASVMAPIAKPEPKCPIDPPPPLVSDVAPPPGHCRAVPKALQSSTRAVLQKRYEITEPHATFQLDFACDGLGPRIAELVIEDGSGHGFSVSAWRARLSKDGEHYELQGFRFSDGGYAPLPPGTPHYQLSGATVDRSVVESQLDAIRAALFAEPSEKVPPPPPGAGIHLSSGSFSSNDFHVLVRMTDTEGHTVEKSFTGYAGSEDQARYLGPVLALERAAPIAKALTFEYRGPTDDDRAFFAERFRRDAPSFHEEHFTWWVKEHFVELATELGSPPMVPALLGVMSADGTDRSSVDTRTDALEAFSRITGLDPRKDDRGTPRPPVEAAQSVLSLCKKLVNP